MVMEAIKELFNKNFINLFFAQLLTHMGDASIQIILMAILVSTVDKPGALIALMLFCFVFPSLIVSIFAGSIVDRFPRKNVMIFSALYRGIILAVSIGLYFMIAKDASLVPMIKIYGVILSFFIGIGTAFFYPAKMASVPNVVNIEALKPANALVSGSGTWALTLGALIVSAILTRIGVLNMFYLTCVMYFMAPALLMFVGSAAALPYSLVVCAAAVHTAMAIMMVVVIILIRAFWFKACKGSDNRRAVQSSFMCIFIQRAKPLEICPHGIHGIGDEQRVADVI